MRACASPPYWLGQEVYSTDVFLLDDVFEKPEISFSSEKQAAFQKLLDIRFRVCKEYFMSYLDSLIDFPTLIDQAPQEDGRYI